MDGDTKGEQPCYANQGRFGTHLLHNEEDQGELDLCVQETYAKIYKVK